MRVGEHWVRFSEDEGDRAVFIKPASEESVTEVLAADLDDDDGRSEWVWVMLPYGDWVLGVFPQGDTYLATENDRVG